MNTIRHFTRRQLSLAACGLALAALLTILPWQVVAQESSETPKSTTKPQVLSDVNAPTAEKSLIGTWRGGPSGSDVLTINKDGTYTWLFRTDNQIANWAAPRPIAPNKRLAQRAMFGPGGPPFGNQPAVRATYTNNSGHWKLDGDTFTLVYQPIPLALRGFMEVQPGMGTPQATDFWPTEFEASGNSYTAQLSIIRIDDSVLRMTGLAPAPGGSPGAVAPTGPKFFKRVDNQLAMPAFAADVPEDQQHVAQLACLNADEAKAMTKWIGDATNYLKMNNYPEASLHVDLLDRIQAARIGKSDFSELFHLTDDEAKAYRDLNKLAGGFGAVCTLGDQGQLTATELTALKKVIKFKERLDTIGSMLEMYLRGPFPDNSPIGIGAAIEPGTDQPSEGASPPANIAERQARLEMLYKLQTLFIELNTWIDSTVFN